VPVLAARLSPQRWALLGLAALAAGVGAELVGGAALPEAAGDLVAGLALLSGGAVAWARRARGGCAALMVLAGAAWFAGEFSDALLYAHRGPLAHLLLAYPSGRVRSRAVGVVVGIAYVDGLVPAIAGSAWPTVALMAALVVAAGARHRAAGGVERRACAVALAGAVAVGGALAFAAIARLSGANADAVALWAYYVAVAVTAVGLTADLLWGRWTRAALTGLVIDLGGRHEPQALRAALARTLGDPGLQVAYRIAGADGWVDETGGPVDLPVGDGAGRAVTFVHEAGDAVAALVHDPAALADRDLAASVAAAARLAVANVGMQAEVAARVRDVDASRRRLVEAGDDERRRLGEELRTGVERRLTATCGRLAALTANRDGEAAVALGRLSAELDDARGDLRRFAQGIHPRALTEHGLGAALAELAAQAAVPVTLAVTERRFPSTHEAAAFFVCSEGLANVAKYADAARVDIAVTATDDRLMVRVADDGTGGADAGRGSGLRGLADRVEALGGTLSVDSPAGAGTRLEATLPVDRAEHS
jgi:signal transduction histidine kinase